MVNWDLSYALLPVIIMFVILIMNEDVSPKKMFAVFSFSMIGALPAAMIEILGTWALTYFYIGFGLDLYAHYPLVQTSYSAIMAFIIIAPTEELLKLLAFKIVSNKINDVYSGIIYGATAALGFAAIENILYVITAERYSIIVAIFRAVLSIPVHTVTGIIIGLAFVNNERRKASDRVILFLLCILLHGTYDFLLETMKDYADNKFMIFVCLSGVGTVILITYALLISLIVAMKRRHKYDYKVYRLGDSQYSQQTQNVQQNIQQNIGQVQNDVSEQTIIQSEQKQSLVRNEQTIIIEGTCEVHNDIRQDRAEASGEY